MTPKNSDPQSLSFLDSLIENLPNMVFVKDAKSLRFVRMNRAGEDLLGTKRSELIGKNDFDFFPEEQARFFTEKDRLVLAGKAVVDIPSEPIHTRHKGLRLLHTKKIPLLDDQGSPEFLLGISEDITEKVQAEEQRLRLVREQAALEERNLANARTEFLASSTAALASSLDSKQTLEVLQKLLVPFLAEECSFTLIGEIKFAKFEQSTGAPFLPKKILIPIALGGRIFGVLCLVTRSDFSVADKNLANELGRRAGIAIEHAHLYETARSAIRSRDEFVSIASHELKTPITALKMQLQMARMGIKSDHAPSPMQLGRALDLALAQVSRLTALIDDLLDLSRIEAGRFSFSFEEVDLGQLTKEVVERYRNNLGGQAFAIEAEALGALPVQCDRTRMEQVLLNLLSNAAKYGAGKPVRVQVERCGTRARLSVVDHGIGIAQEKLDKIFERFERVASSSHISGLGLGLYITREILKGHQGTVAVQSRVGEGSTFIVELPLL